MNDDYPVQFSIDYGDGTRNRLTTLFRIIMIIPIAIVGYVLTLPLTGASVYGGSYWVDGPEMDTLWIPSLGFGVFLMVLFRQKYPRWVFNFLLEAARFASRVASYGALLVDQYPSTDDHQSVHLDIEYPDAENDLNRFLPLIKWLLAIPHYIVLVVLGIIALIITIIAWFAIIITGKYPAGMFNFVVGVGRWWNRVAAYAFLLTTDRYPPFRLSP